MPEEERSLYLCVKCGESKERSEFYEYPNRKFKNGLPQVKYPCKECRYKYDKNKTTIKSSWYYKLRNTVVDGYGAKCACCGETCRAFLALDHVNGGGNKQRKEAGPSAHYADALRRNYPPDYQLLCHNCNIAKSIQGVCPHQNPDYDNTYTPPPPPLRVIKYIETPAERRLRRNKEWREWYRLKRGGVVRKYSFAKAA
jgi:hypothetical protein